MTERSRGAEQPSTNELRELVQNHKVCWQVWPLRHVDKKAGMRAIGYELELVGTHHEPAHTPNPGCDECAYVYEQLQKIAFSILPEQHRDSVYRIQPFDHAMRFSQRRSFRKDVELTVTIQHRKGFGDPIDACETLCLGEMEQSLASLGARRGRW